MTGSKRIARKTPFRTLLQSLGPGLVTGAADDDPSGIATYSQAGAQFGYGLLWTVFLTTPFMIAIQLVSAYIGRVTGKVLAANVKGIVWLTNLVLPQMAERRDGVVLAAQWIRPLGDHVERPAAVAQGIVGEGVRFLAPPGGEQGNGPAGDQRAPQRVPWRDQGQSRLRDVRRGAGVGHAE